MSYFIHVLDVEKAGKLYSRTARIYHESLTQLMQNGRNREEAINILKSKPKVVQFEVTKVSYSDENNAFLKIELHGKIWYEGEVRNRKFEQLFLLVEVDDKGRTIHQIARDTLHFEAEDDIVEDLENLDLGGDDFDFDESEEESIAADGEDFENGPDLSLLNGVNLVDRLNEKNGTSFECTGTIQKNQTDLTSSGAGSIWMSRMATDGTMIFTNRQFYCSKKLPDERAKCV